MHRILVIALPTPLRRLFEYLPPESMTLGDFKQLQPGMRICVPFSGRVLVGILIHTADATTISVDKLRPAIEIIDTNPVITNEIMELCTWAAEYYHHPLGETLQAALPIELRKNTPLTPRVTRFWRHTTEGKGLPSDALKRSPQQQKLHQLLLSSSPLSQEQLKLHGITQQTLNVLQKKQLICFCETPSDNHKPESTINILKEPPLPLNPEQEAALEQIQYHHYNTYLLDGTTGSGKTEVYLHAINRALQAGNQALVLVPEIGLAPQTLTRFKQRFMVNIAELHSSITPKQRTLNWLAAATGEAKIIIGTRLSIFTPMPNLGIIIIDEEHDLSFKQQDGLRYSARDLAVIRAHKKKIPLLMGSATPSLETLYNTISKQNYLHLKLTQRAGSAKPPELKLTDMRSHISNNGFAQSSLDAIKATLEQKQQVLVFINRRGYAPALLCQHCGWSATCTHCDVKLTLHSNPQHLCCHHCNRHRPVPKKCPSCLNPQLHTLGQGTERCELTLQIEFPYVDVIRVDQDSMQHKNAMKDLYCKLHKGEPCILIGTQMLAKGHHFPKVTLVILLDLDQGLFSGDFRGLERMAQQITQVSGRSGRGDIYGQVILQTYKPDHPMLQLLLTKGYHEFSQTLLQIRADAHLPPISYMAILRAESKRVENVIDFLKLAHEKAKALFPPTPHHEYLGPIPALLERRNERYRYQLQFKYTSRGDLQTLFKELLNQLDGNPLSKRVRWSIDVDPQDMA